MTFYHGTTQEKWTLIQKEKCLWGKIDDCNGKYHPSRFTYLTPYIEEASCYGDILLEVQYDPIADKRNNNYCADCWQFRVYSPISLENIKQL